MKIVHINLCGPVTDGWTYQDNILPKYHRKLGNSVTMITSQYVWGNDGKITKDERSSYVNKDDVKYIRLENKFNTDIQSKFKVYKGLLENINKEKPDILFIHGVQFLDLFTVIRFMKKNSKTKLFIDNHADFNNSAKNFFSKLFLHKIIWRKLAHKILPYTEKFYGVMPSRVKFLEDVYKIPKSCTELLLMGADDDYLVNNHQTVDEMRKKYQIKANEFLIVTGGKIDNGKKQTLLLMEAVNNIKRNDVKLLIFGSIDSTINKQFQEKLSDRVIHAGWINPKNTYDLFNMADLVCFPGSHSVFWEQVTAIGKPMLLKYWEGISHLDFNGNIKYIYKDNATEILNSLNNIIMDDNVYFKMKERANSDSKSNFYYSVIAKNSIKTNLKEEV